jgi:Mg/Co/Ni transporter MgtE
MPANDVGKLLFPRLQPSQYGEKFKIIAATILVGLAVGGTLALVMILRGAVGK